MILTAPLLLLALTPQDWSAFPLPSLSTAPAHVEGPELLGTGSHVALFPDPVISSPYPEASLAPSLLTQLVTGHFSRSGLSLIPGSNPLLVRAPAKEQQELKAIFSALEDASQSLQIRLQVSLLPGIHEALPADSLQSDSPAAGSSAAPYNGSVRSGDSITFGTRSEHGFVGGYEIDVATDAGVADPLRSSAASGETIHLTCSRVRGGRAVHVEGVLDLAQITEITSFDPDTPDLGQVEQPTVAVCQIAFSGVVTAERPLRVAIQGSETFGDRTLFVSAVTQEDPPAPAVGWAVRDLAFLASKGLPLTPPTPGLRPSSASNAPVPGSITPTSPGSLAGLLTDRNSSIAEAPRVHSTERLLLIPVTAPNKQRGLPAGARTLPDAVGNAESLVAAMETALLAQRQVTIRYGELRVELCTTHGRLARVLFGAERPWLVDYRTDIAPNSWMPSPVTEVAFDGLCLEARCDANELTARWWISDTPDARIADSSVANLGALQKVERSYTAGNERLERGASRNITGLAVPLELALE
jgi:hypothetical protein